MKLIFISNRVLIALSLVLLISVSNWGMVDSVYSIGIMCVVLMLVGSVIAFKNKLGHGLPHILAGGFLAVIVGFIGGGSDMKSNERIENFASKPVPERSRRDLSQLQSDIPRVGHQEQLLGSNDGTERLSVAEVPAAQSGSTRAGDEGGEIKAIKENESIRIKGFYIGMDIIVASQMIQEKTGKFCVSGYFDTSKGNVVERGLLTPDDFPDSRFVGPMPKQEGFKYVILYPKGVVGGPADWNCGAFMAQPNGQVVYMAWGGSLVRHLFRAEGLEVSEFVQRFVDSYGLPGMSVSGNGSHWKYTSPEGVEIKIQQDFGIQIKKVIGEEELNKAFD